MDPAFTQSLLQTLEQTIAPDTNVIKAATVQLNTHFYKTPQCVPSLFEIGTTAPNPAIRQLALVELRKRVKASKSKFYTGQPEQVRTAIKERALQVIIQENSSQARAALAGLISAIAFIEVPLYTWPTLLPTLIDNIVNTSSEPRHCEVALQTLYSLVDTIVLTPSTPPPVSTKGKKGAAAANGSSGIEENVLNLLGLYGKVLENQDHYSLQSRIWSMRGLGKLAEFIEPGEEREIAAFQSLIPGIVGVISQTLESGDEVGAKNGFEVIEGLTLADAPLLTPHLMALVQFLLSASSNRAYDGDMRIMALNALLWIIKFKKSKIMSLNLAGPIITSLLPIGAEPEPTDLDEIVPARTAFRVIDTLAVSLPPAQVFPPLFEKVREFLQSPDPMMRKSAITAFGVVVEGCSAFIEPHLETLWPLVDGGLGDPEIVVRKAACTALSCLCEMLGDECAQRHAVLLPLIFKLLGDEPTQRSACVALDCLLEVLGADIQPYLAGLMDGLLRLLETAPINLKLTVVGAIGSAAHASKEKFAPYFEASMQRIVPLLQLTEEGEELDLRGVAQDTLGTLAEAVGKDLFRPYYEPLLKISMEAIAVPNAPQLKECSYIFWAVISRVFNEDFANYLPMIMPILMAAVQQSEVDETALLASAANGEFTTGVESDDEDDQFEDLDEDIGSEDDEDGMYSASTAIAIEKECAMDALTEIFAHTKTPFLPYIEPIVKAVLPSLQHQWHDGIRKSAVACLLGFVTTFYQMSELPKWKKGASVTPLQSNVAQLASAVLPDIMAMWKEEEDRDAVHELCNSFSAALMVVGPALIVPDYVQPICEHLDALLKRTAPCQIDYDAEGDDAVAAGEQSEYDAALISAACDLVGTLATTLGGDFAQLFSTFLPSMAQYYDLERAASDRSSAIGSLGEIVNGLESAVTPFTDALFPLFLQSLSDPDAEVYSNAAFGLGSLIFHSQTDLSGQYFTVLGALRHLFETSGSGTTSTPKIDNAKDNACGTVARMILKNHAALPMDQVLPVFLSALPLRRDFAESEKVFDAIFSLFHAHNPIVYQNLDHILQVFRHALESVSSGVFYPDDDSAQIPETTQVVMIQLIKEVNSSQHEKIAAAELGPYLT